MSKRKKEIVLIILCLFLAFIIKLSFAPAIIYQYDIQSFAAWSLGIAQEGVVNSYEVQIQPQLSPVNYPPGSMYVFALLGWLGKALPGALLICLLKLPSILFDLATATAIYLIFRKKYNAGKAFWPFFLYLVNPAAWLSSSLWGSTDSWHSFLILLSLYFLYEKKYLLTGLFLGLAAMMKPQALIFIPFIFVFLLLKTDWKKTIYAGLASLGTVLFICLPWIVADKGKIVLSIILSPMGYFTRLSSFAFNLWYLIYGYISININDHQKIFYFLDYRYLGLAIFLSIYLILIIWLVKQKNLSKERSFFLIFVGAAIIAQAFFLFCSEMHERYMFQVMPLVLMLYFYSKEIKNFYLFFALSIFINTTISLMIPNLLDDKMALMIVDNVSRVLSLLNILVFGWFVYYMKKLDQGLTQ